MKKQKKSLNGFSMDIPDILSWDSGRLFIKRPVNSLVVVDYCLGRSRNGKKWKSLICWTKGTGDRDWGQRRHRLSCIMVLISYIYLASFVWLIREIKLQQRWRPTSV